MKRLFIVGSIVAAIAITSITAFATTNTNQASQENTTVTAAPNANVTTYANLSDYINKVTPDSSKPVAALKETLSKGKISSDQAKKYFEDLNTSENEIVNSLKTDLKKGTISSEQGKTFIIEVTDSFDGMKSSLKKYLTSQENTATSTSTKSEDNSTIVKSLMEKINYQLEHKQISKDEANKLIAKVKAYYGAK